jgi:hypothetical protein
LYFIFNFQLTKLSVGQYIYHDFVIES